MGIGCVGMMLLGLPVMMLLGAIVYVVVAVGHAVAPFVWPAIALASLAVVTWAAPSFYRGFRSAYDDSSTAGWVGVAFLYALWVAAAALVSWLL